MGSPSRLRVMRAFEGGGGKVAAICAVLGAAVGVLFVWLQRPDAPAEGCTTTSDGLRACILVHVVPPPLWAYFVLGAGGALAGLLLALGALGIRRQLARRPNAR
jgi:hypothetical protein